MEVITAKEARANGTDFDYEEYINRKIKEGFNRIRIYSKVNHHSIILDAYLPTNYVKNRIKTAFEEQGFEVEETGFGFKIKW